MDYSIKEHWNKNNTYKTSLYFVSGFWYVATYDYSEGTKNSQYTHYKYFEKKKDALLYYKVQKQWVNI
jgi:hypothetical protein